MQCPNKTESGWLQQLSKGQASNHGTRHPCKVVAIGEMKARLDELEGGDDTVANPPPLKKARKVQRKVKENKTAQSRKRKANKHGRILLVGAQPYDQSKLPGTSTDSPNEQAQPQDQPSTSRDHQKEPQDQPPSSTDSPKEQTQCQDDQPSTSAEQTQSQDQSSTSVDYSKEQSLTTSITHSLKMHSLHGNTNSMHLQMHCRLIL